MNARGFVVTVAVCGLGLVALQPVAPAAAAAAGSVSLGSDSADLDTFQFVNDSHQNETDKSGDDFLTFAEHRAPAKSKGLEGTASAFVSQSSSLETPGEPPFPLSPLNDIGMSGTSTSAATATGNGRAVPVSDSDGSFEVSFDTSSAVPVFFNGFLHTTNTDPNDSCSSVTVDVSGAAFNRHFAAFTGDCPQAGPHQKGWAETDTLQAGTEYTIDVEYSSEVDDVVPDEPASMSAAATASLNLSFFPPTARFSQSLSGSTGRFDGSGSSVGGADDRIAKWEWTFGDGKRATTTAPTVTHRYPLSPRRTRSYTVTLQVVEAGGAVSPAISRQVLGTATSVGVTKAAHKIDVSGKLEPNRRGKALKVTLSRKRGGSFHALATHRLVLSRKSHFATSYSRPAFGMCRLVASYAGDKTHLASSTTKNFGC
jgi:hypothetical protein